MRRKNLLWTCLIALLLTSAGSTVQVTFGAAAKLEVDPPLVEDIFYPDTFNLTVTVTNVNNLYGWEFTISFATILNVSSHIVEHPPGPPGPPVPWNETVYHVYEGPFLQAVNATDFNFAVNNEFGEVSVLCMLEFDEETGAWPPVGASGSGVLAKIEFQAVGMGQCLLDLHSTDLLTVKGTPPDQYVDSIAHTAADGLFDNRIGNADPIPWIEIIHPGMVLPVVGQPITFDASLSEDPDGWLTSYEWDFGDGGSGNGMVVDHVFDEVGVYTVSLTVVDNDGATVTDSCGVNVVEWMEGGEFPDILDAWPEKYEWNEVAKGRELMLFGLVGNPTEDRFWVYVEFAIFDRENGGKLGEVTSDTQLIEPGETLTLNAIVDLCDTSWRVMRPHWTYWSNARLSVNHKYEVFATCYHKPYNSGGDFEQGFATQDTGFKVLGAEHDIAVLEVTTNATDGVQKGDVLAIYVLIDNVGGNYDETFNITVIYKGLTMGGLVEERTVTLKQQETRTETFTLDTSTLDLGFYLIKADISVLTFEENTLDNSGSTSITVV